MSEVDLPAYKKQKTSNQIDTSKLDVDINLKSPKEEILAPGVSEMIEQAIAQNYIPLARLPPRLNLPE